MPMKKRAVSDVSLVFHHPRTAMGALLGDLCVLRNDEL